MTWFYNYLSLLILGICDSLRCLSVSLQEFGGYFIVNGNERLIRMLVATRRNYVSGHWSVREEGSVFVVMSCDLSVQPLAVNRSSWKTRGPLYTEHGVMIRCVRKDQTASVRQREKESLVTNGERKRVWLLMVLSLLCRTWPFITSVMAAVSFSSHAIRNSFLYPWFTS